MAAAAPAARAAGVQSMVGFNYRRVPALALARELIAEGRLGTVRHVRAAYLQDWLADAESPMTWRLRKETAGSGALGDIASHAIDQVLFLLGDAVTEVSGRLQHLRDTRARARTGRKTVTVDDAAWATLSLASGTIACRGGLPGGHRPEERAEDWRFTDRTGTSLFDLENLNELGFLDATVPRPGAGLPADPGQRARTPLPGGAGGRQGHVIGWEHTFTHQIRDFLAAIDAGTARRRRRSRTAWPSSGSWPPSRIRRRKRRHQPSVRAAPATSRPPASQRRSLTMPRPYTLFTGQWADLPFEEVARLASGWGYDGLEIAVSGDHLDAWRWDEPGYVESKLAVLEQVQPEGLGHLQPPQGPGRLR